MPIIAVYTDEQPEQATLGQIAVIEQMIKLSPICPTEVDRIYRGLGDMSATEAADLIDVLKQNQLQPSHTGPTGQKEISKFIKQICL